MQPKQSSIASGMYSRSRAFPPPIPIRTETVDLAGTAAVRGASSARSGSWPPPSPDLAQGEGLLHDVRNLMGALGLYCDLLSVTGVLKPEHRHYATDLRLLGTRSGAMIERLMHPTVAQGGWSKSALADPVSKRGEVRSSSSNPSPGGARMAGVELAGGTVSPAWQGSVTRPVKPVSLRFIVERCSGLLSQVADGRTIKVSYGAAASLPALVAEEAVERILVNLVRNSASSLDRRWPAGNMAAPSTGECAGYAERVAAQGAAVGDTALSAARHGLANPASDETSGVIRIGVGFLLNGVGDPRGWPFRRVRLTVEDSGCGMAEEQLERVVCGGRAPSRSSHRIGFRVVRELVYASDGDLRVMSAPGAGTRVQIEWPVAAMSVIETAETGYESDGALVPDRRASPFAELSPGGTQVQQALGAREASAAAGVASAAEMDEIVTRAEDSGAGAGRWMSC